METWRFNISICPKVTCRNYQVRKKIMTKNNSKVICWYLSLSRIKSFLGKGRMMIRVIGSETTIIMGRKESLRK